MTTKKAVILVNLGTPEAATEEGIRNFLKAFLMDRRVVDLPRWFWRPLLNIVVLPLRSKRVTHAYQQIWMDGGSPLMVYSKAQQEALQQVLGEEFIVELAMTYGEPSLNTVWKKLKSAGVSDICLIPLYPQYSSTTTAPVLDAWHDILKIEHAVPSFSFIAEHYQYPEYTDALKHSILTSGFQPDSKDSLLFSFHGIPERYSKRGDPYAEQCHQTAANVAKSLGLPDSQWQVSFQSRFGREKWLEPYTDAVLESLPKKGSKRLFIISPAFSVDCLETLEEIAQEGKQTFIAAGGESFHYIPALNQNAEYIHLLAKIALKQLN